MSISALRYLKKYCLRKSVYLNHHLFEFFRSSNLPDVYLLVFWLTLHFFFCSTYQMIAIIPIVLTFTQLVLYICWFNKLPTTISFIIFWHFSTVLPNFPFTTSETTSNYYLQTWCIWVASRVAEQLKTSKIRKYQEIVQIS